MNKEIIDKILLASIGAMFMTKERAEEIFNEYLQKWEVEKAVRGTMVDDLIKQSQEAHRELEKILAEHVNEMAKKLNLARNDDLRRVEDKIDRLLNAQGLTEQSDTESKAQQPESAGTQQ